MSRILLAGCTTILIACTTSTDTEPLATTAVAKPILAPIPVPAEPWEPLLHPNLANGFDFPVGNENGKGKYHCAANNTDYNGWYIATHTAEEYSLGIHTGEDWNGNGGGNTDLGQPVFATATGTVLHAGDFGYP